MWFRTSKEQAKATQGATPSDTQTPFYPEDSARTTAGQAADNVTEAVEQGASRAPGFFRRHPVLTVAGAAGMGLLGGIEMALGVAVGAGVLALIRPRSSQRAQEARPDGEGAWRERAQEMWDHAPGELRKRARAVIEAARGRTEAASQA